LPEGQRPQPWSPDRCGGLHDAADHNAVGEHILIVVIPLAEGTEELGRA
jgi:hypothetical protein